jgi:hypothetical protein
VHMAPAFRAYGDWIIRHALPALKTYAALITLVFVQWHTVPTSRPLSTTVHYTPSGRLVQGHDVLSHLTAPSPSLGGVPATTMPAKETQGRQTRG